MYITDLVSYNLLVFRQIAIAPLFGVLESVRKLYYTKVRRMSSVDYHLKMLSTMVVDDGESLRMSVAVYTSAKHILQRAHHHKLADALATNFNILVYLKSFAIDKNIVSGYRMLSALETLDDLIEMLIFLEYCDRRSIMQAIDANTYANRKEIHICTYSGLNANAA